MRRHVVRGQCNERVFKECHIVVVSLVDVVGRTSVMRFEGYDAVLEPVIQYRLFPILIQLEETG